MALQLVTIHDVVMTGIEYEPLLPGLVPLFEEREAAVFSHYRWADWVDLPTQERAAAVAHFRLHGLIALHQADALNAAMERRNRQQQMMQSQQR